MKLYYQLSEDLKEEAKLLHPLDYKDWEYQVQGVEIAWSATGIKSKVSAIFIKAVEIEFPQMADFKIMKIEEDCGEVLIVSEYEIDRSWRAAIGEFVLNLIN